jgi:protein required for attachment to host cells
MAKATTSHKTPANNAPRTWIVVADGGQARILESGYPHSGVVVRLDVTSDALQTGGQLAGDRLPRTQESRSSARHGIEPRVGLKDHERRAFATRLADYLSTEIGNFDALVVVAPMRFLDLLRNTFPDDVARKISATRSKDLTWMSDTEVLDHLGPLGAQVRRECEGV